MPGFEQGCFMCLVFLLLPVHPIRHGRGMRTESVIEIHTSKLLSEWTGLYLLHSWRQGREQEGEQGDKGSHCQTL